MKALQSFSDEYLTHCRQATPEQILEFLESFRLMQAKPSKSKLISLKVPEALLSTFRRRCELQGLRYQTQIKALMERWLAG